MNISSWMLMWNISMWLCLDKWMLVFSKHFIKICLIIQKFQFTNIPNFNVITFLTKNTRFGVNDRGYGRWLLRRSIRMDTAGYCYHWHRKQLLSPSKNCGDSSWFPCGLPNIHFCWRDNIFHLVSYGTKFLLWKLQEKFKAKQILLNASIFPSWVNPEIKV